MRITEQCVRTARWAMLLALLFVRQSTAASLHPETLNAWDKDVQSAKAELSHDCHHLRPSTRRGSPPGESDTAPQVSGEMLAVPSGLIHHWTGSVFIPNVQATDVLSVLQGYESYADVYKPAVIESKLLSHTADAFNYRLKFVQKGFGIKAGLMADLRTTYYRPNPESGYSITEATQVFELQNPGTPEEKILPASATHGYVQRVLTIVRYQQSQGGASVEVETLTLSRGVPGSVRWFIAPLVERFSRQTMATTLERLRDRVLDTRSFASAATR